MKYYFLSNVKNENMIYITKYYFLPLKRLIAFGVLNLTQHQGDTKPEQLRTGSWYVPILFLETCNFLDFSTLCSTFYNVIRYDASVEIDAIGYRMLQGHRIVLNVSCSYWPMIWTPRRCTNISFRKAHLSLPIIHNLEKAEDKVCHSSEMRGLCLMK